MKNLDLQRISGQQEISLHELWRIALRRKWIIFSTAVTVFVLIVLYSFLATPIYTATGQLLIDKEPNILSFEEIFKIESFNDDYFQTQYKLLQSRALAGNTIERVRLHKNEGFVKAALGARKPGSEGSNDDPIIKRKLIKVFLERLTIRPIRKTRLVQASFSDSDPELAAETLTSFFDAYIEMNVQRKYQATEQATDFLSTQIAMVQAEIEESERELQEYGEEKDIVVLNSTENTVIEKLSELNRALTDAQIDRVNKETYYNEIAVATPDYIPDALANPLIQKLREEYNRLNREYVKRSETFFPDHPDMQSLKSELDTAKKALEDETQALIKRAYSDFQAALKRERAMANAFNRQKREAFQLNSNAIQYNSLQIQIQNQKDLLESLMKRKSETDVSSRLKALRTSNIWVVDPAEVPSSPSSPDKMRNMIFGLLIGLFSGFGLAFLFERLDDTVKNEEDIKIHAGMPMLGIIPEFSENEEKSGDGKKHKKKSPKAKEKPKWFSKPKLKRILNLFSDRKAKPRKEEQGSVDLIVHFSPISSISEYYRSIRTTILLSGTEARMRALAVMSPLPQEGKTATISNLAGVLAQAGKKVVIIDADLRKPRLHKIFRVRNSNGLTRYLTEDLPIEDVLRATAVPKLFLINAGKETPNPVELLGSEKMANLIVQLKHNFEYILIDTPPVLGVSDAIVLGPWLDGAIMVVRAGATPRKALRQANEKLDAHKIKGMGVIINQVQMSHFDNYYTDAYYEYYRRTEA
ncbi:MAG: polysaccharide biosynthesis tyrosine autokinase [Candidatus Aminicenantes bacterium]|nr:MAG: polysaccharide biosynthesis tyrosine autokinase [Candidatus Aminicenantes bacterium]